MWTKLEAIADKDHWPAAREGHVAVMIKNGTQMLIHGGLNQKSDCFGDAFVLVGLHKELDRAQSEIKYHIRSGKVTNSDYLKQWNIKNQGYEALRWFKCK